MLTTTDDTRLATLLLGIISTVIALPLLFMSLGMIGYGSMMGGMWGDGAMPGWMFVVGVVTQLLFLAALVGGVYLVYRAVADRRSVPDRALEELRLAYARGDLTDEEYEQRRETLERDADRRRHDPEQ